MRNRLFLIAGLVLWPISVVHTVDFVPPAPNTNEIVLRPLDFFVSLGNGTTDITLEYQRSFEYGIVVGLQASLITRETYIGTSIRPELGIHPFSAIGGFLGFFYFETFGGYHYGSGDLNWTDFSWGLSLSLRASLQNIIYVEPGIGYEYYFNKYQGVPFWIIGIGFIFP